MEKSNGKYFNEMHILEDRFTVKSLKTLVAKITPLYHFFQSHQKSSKYFPECCCVATDGIV